MTVTRIKELEEAQLATLANDFRWFAKARELIDLAAKYPMDEHIFRAKTIEGVAAALAAAYQRGREDAAKFVESYDWGVLPTRDIVAAAIRSTP